jgi:tetratricopeptide (TPR) repeat protein
MNLRKPERLLALAVLSSLLVRSPASVAQVAPPAPPSDVNKAEASSHFRRGVAFYKDGDFRDALVEFRRAYQLAPSNQVLYNVARCYSELHENAKAITTFDRYLENATPTELDEVKRRAIVSEMQRLEQRVARVDARVAVDRADVAIDGEVVGMSPLPRAIVIDSGSHTVSASKAGYVPATKKIDVAAGDHVVLELDLLPASPQPPATTSTPPGATESSPDRRKHGGPSTAAWVTGASTLIFAAAGTTFGVLALNAHGDLSSATSSLPGDAATISRDHERMQAFSAAADIAGALAVCGGAATIVLLVTGGATPSDSRRGVAWDMGPLGVSARGRF